MTYMLRECVHVCTSMCLTPLFMILMWLFFEKYDEAMEYIIFGFGFFKD